MRYLSVCSGIEAATAAWHGLGFEPTAFSEVEPFPRAVLAHHYPAVPNLGDMTGFKEWPNADIDLLVGGTPCQSFSAAGLRKGLDDPRGNLMLTYLAVAERYRPKWLVWENVPGVLSVDGGRAFGSLLGGLGQLGYGFAYRILDAQYFGVPQRRRRVFVVGHLGDWRRAAAVLFERHSLSGNPPPRRRAGENIAGTFKACAGSGGWSNSADHAAAGYMQAVSPTLQARTKGGGGLGTDFDCDGGLVAFNWQAGGNQGDLDANPERTGALQASQQPAVAFDLRGRAGGAMPEGAHDTANIRAASGGSSRSYLAQPSAVRRLTPLECERLQGFHDGYTKIPVKIRPAPPSRRALAGFPDLYDENPDGTWTQYAADGPRYKALGNSMAVPVMRWIGERIQRAQRLT